VKIRPVGSELFHEDGQATRRMTKLRVAFRNFANAPVRMLFVDENNAS